MTCLKKIKNTEVFGSKFSSRTLTTAGDISGYSFKAVVKNIIQGKILEIPGVKNAGTINFDFSQLQTLKKSTYKIEYWGDFGALGNEPFLLEEFSIVSAENATNCTNSDNLNFEINFEEISIPVTITKAINNFSLNIESLSDEQKAQLKGPKGDKGEKGEKGEQGVQGEKGDKGDKGDAFTFNDFTPTQIAELQKPATDKVVELDALELSLNNSESLRVQNENTRISSENTRNTNEQSRVNAENNRVTAENSRSNAETTRVNSENTRISNENSRVSAENTRVSNESSRVTAESVRITAENERVAAENARKAALDLKLSIESQSTTGTVISFSTDKVYGTLATPETGNVTADVTNAKLGVTNIIIHNSGTVPNFGSQFKKLSGSGNYVVGVVNYIYCTFITATEIIYSINQRS